MVEVSVICNTWRIGGIDLTFEGLARQTFKDFEVVLVDHRYEHRHKQVMEYAKELGLNVIHVPEHHRNGKWNVLTAGWNTGFMLSEGRVIIMLMDYAYMRPNWVEKHLSYHAPNSDIKFVMGAHEYRTTPKIKIPFNELSIFENQFKPEIMSGLKLFKPPHADPKLTLNTGSIGYTYTHMKNESFLREIVYDVNGCDENFDKGKGPSDNEFGYRFMLRGCSILLDKELTISCSNPRFVLPTMPWGKMNESVEGRWSYYDGERYQNTRYAELLNTLKAKGRIKSLTPYELSEKRNEILHWRDGSKLIDVKKIDKHPESLVEKGGYEKEVNNCTKCDVELITDNIIDFLEQQELFEEIYTSIDPKAVIGLCPKCNSLELRQEML